MKNKNLIIALVVIAILVAVYYYTIKTPKATDSGDSDNNDSGGGNNSGPAWWKILPSVRWPMAFKNMGRQVGYIQRFLNQKHGHNLSVDAIYGPETNQAWITYLGTTGDYASFELDGVDAVYEYQYDDYVKPFEPEL